MDKYNILTKDQYNSIYKDSITNPEEFWSEIASKNFIWKNKWDTVLEWDFKQAKVNWFQGAKLNITENCLDRHLQDNSEKTAIIFEPNNPKDSSEKITYRSLFERVCKMSNVLKEKGVKKGDRVCIYLPMIPELAISVLACARIGAIHSVIFAGFSSNALATRINDCESRIVITSEVHIEVRKL